ncbi:hypothetical protein ACN20G_03620 [Streptomyces sp. BI20]|uniref:hypothetical protein n=1 Tax=Streptomyces sp. BI20 TaxID=3403460 RepID=UPI003C75D883
MDEGGYCGTGDGAAGGTSTGAADGPPFADCGYCGKPTEHGTATPGLVLCPVCAWQEAQRTACSG